MNEMTIDTTKSLLFKYRLSAEQRQKLRERLRKGELGRLSFLGYVRPHKGPIQKGFSAFVKCDRPNKGPIMAEANTAMEAWFASGVKYRRDPILGASLPPDIMMYAMPRALKGLLETAFGKIASNVMQWEDVSEYLIGQVLMAVPALPSGILAAHELEADFGLHVNPLPWGPVFWTRRLPPKRRAEIVGSRWYYTQASRIYAFVGRQHAQIQAERGRRSIWQIDKFLDLQRTLKELNLDLADRVQYYECRLRDFKYTEVSSILAMLGVKRRPGAVRTSYCRQKRLVEEKQKISAVL